MRNPKKRIMMVGCMVIMIFLRTNGQIQETHCNIILEKGDGLEHVSLTLNDC